ncbi:MAG: LacI family DNA-binding transcriptional regulator [Clostridia bacterium]|nr:LacI family DNA-binding transcriptional regulator [Clostridia bacterium]
MAVTMRDLGKRLGVSAVTVSKALAGKSGVSEEMRQKIVKLAAELGYVNPNTQQPKASSGLDVGIIIPSPFFSSDSFYAMMYKSLVQELAENGHFGLLELVSRETQRNLILPNLLRSRKVDALVLLGQPDETYVDLLVKQSVPVVCMDFYNTSARVDMVIGDSAGGASALTQHLIAQGHRDIAYYGSVKATSSIMERYLGYLAAMMSNDLPVCPEYLISDRDEEGALQPFVMPEKRPTAIVCNSDWSARWLIDQLGQRGVRVPEDVSIVGFDDFNYVPATFPALTTYRVDQKAMCRIVVQLVSDRCAGDKKPFARITVGGECVYRDSVKPVAN